MKQPGEGVKKDMGAQELPLVSVLVPSYNHARYVGRTIESIVSQTYPNIELIVVDDGSSDESPAILAELSRAHGFRFERNERNLGISATRNRLISLASGRYLCGCASDDFYAPDKVARQVAFLEAHPEYAMCHGRVVNVDEEGNELPTPRATAPSGWVFRELLLKEFTIQALTHMERREVFDEVGLYDESLGVEDWYMWLKIARRFQIGFMDEVLAYQRRHPTNTMHRKLFFVSEQEKVLALYRRDELYPEARRAWNLRAFGMLARKHKPQALAYMLRSLPQFYKRPFLEAAARLVLRW